MQEPWAPQSVCGLEVSSAAGWPPASYFINKLELPFFVNKSGRVHQMIPKAPFGLNLYDSEILLVKIHNIIIITIIINNNNNYKNQILLTVLLICI